jgi:hypothetical protein
MQEISSPKLVESQGRNVIGGIQPRFVCQSTYADYYELMKYWEVELIQCG